MVGNMHAKTQKDAEGPVGPSTWHGGGYKPSSVPALRQGALIPLTGPLPAGSSGLPGNRPPRGGSGDGSRRSPYLALHRTGFAVPRPSPAKRWALTPPFHPYPARGGAVCFLWHFPSRCRGWALPSVLPSGVRTFLGPARCGIASACRLRCHDYFTPHRRLWRRIPRGIRTGPSGRRWVVSRSPLRDSTTPQPLSVPASTNPAPDEATFCQKAAPETTSAP